ncbi:MAG: hypothetical protein ACYCST_11155 [Acidimicrobiales bacterium]
MRQTILMVHSLLHLPALATAGATAVRALTYKEASLPGTGALTGFIGVVLEISLVLSLIGIVVSVVARMARGAGGGDES